jgi:hypothetical protein
MRTRWRMPPSTSRRRSGKRGAERLEAIRAARAATGLTANRMAKYLNNGSYYADVPGLDANARELAGMYPELGIGVGYDPDGPDLDYAPPLWEMLAEADPVPRPRHHPDVIREAIGMVGLEKSAPQGAFRFSAAKGGEYLVRVGIPWPQLAGGGLALDDDTFREMGKLYPAEIGPIREARHTLGQMRRTNSRSDRTNGTG